MAGVFVSYAREDSAKARVIANALEAASFDVWFDERIHSGSEYSREIEQALGDASAVVVLWSKHSVDSAWVRDEAAEGRDSGRLVSVLLDDSRPPIGFRQFQVTDMSNWGGRGTPKQLPEILAAIGAKGGKSTQSKPEPSVKPRPRVVLWGATAAALLAILGAALYFWFDRSQIGEPSAKPTIALQTFTATSADAGLRDVAAQARDSVSHALSASGIPVRSLDAGQGARQASDYVLAGEVSRSGDKLVATVRLDDTGHGLTVFSRRFEAGRDDGSFAERIGAQIAGNIAWASPLIALETRHPSDPAITADLFRQLDFLGDPLEQYQLATRAAAKAPNSAFAQVAAAFNTAFVLDGLPSQERSQALNAGRRSSARAIELAPEFGDAYATWCFLHSPVYLKECEDRLLVGKRIDPDAPFVNSFLARLMRAVGRVNESLDMTRLSYAHDPYVPTKIGWMLMTLEISGEKDDAQELYEQGIRWWPEFRPFFIRNRMSGIVQRGDFEGLLALANAAGPKGPAPEYASIARLVAAVRTNSIPAAKSACADAHDQLAVSCMLALAKLGDADASYRIADALYPPRAGRTPSQSERMWLSQRDELSLDYIASAAAAPLRRDPRYVALADRVGLLDYWRSGRLPDFCQPPRPEPVCAQLRRR